MTGFQDTEIADLFAPLAGLGKVALAVSGGSDSMALMALADQARAVLDDSPEFVVLTVDHGLRAEAAQETDLVAATAKRLGFDCRVLAADVKLVKGNIQAGARDLRYRLMCDACHEIGATGLVTAHHLEDQAETFLLRLARGSGVDGLGAMAPQSWRRGIRLVRPFLDISKSRLRGFLASRDPEIRWVEDPSNEDTAYDRVKFRNLAPRLKDAGLTAERLVETARRMRDAEMVLERVADELATRAVIVDPAGHCTIARVAFSRALPETRLRLLSRCLMAVGGQPYRPRMARVRNVVDAILADGVCRRTLTGNRIEIGREKIEIWREFGRRGLGEITLGPGDTKIWDGRFRVSGVPHAIQFAGRGVTVRALGHDGWRIARGQAEMPTGMPPRAALAQTLVSFWEADRLIAVPHLKGFPGKADLRAEFLGSAQIHPGFRSGPDAVAGR